MSTASLTWRHCGICDQEEAFEAPPCRDGHGAECPDYVCTECGSVITMGIVLVPTAEISIDVAA